MLFEKRTKYGALAHLARAFDWQSKGDEFDSRMLHKIGNAANQLLKSWFAAFFILYL